MWVSSKVGQRKLRGSCPDMALCGAAQSLGRIETSRRIGTFVRSLPFTQAVPGLSRMSFLLCSWRVLTQERPYSRWLLRIAHCARQLTPARTVFDEVVVPNVVTVSLSSLRNEDCEGERQRHDAASSIHR